MTLNCKYQDRYLKHQDIKKITIEKQICDKKISSNYFDNVITNRKSSRIFSDEKLTASQLNYLKEVENKAPSSCNRKAVYSKIIFKTADIEKFLVGGKGWIQNADVVMLFFADMKAYKSPNEVLFMPFLDAGVKCMMVSLGAERMGIKNCIVNPNVRSEDELAFRQMYNKGGDKFCIALALGL